jgi:PDZ domain/Aspartyl protease
VAPTVILDTTYLKKLNVSKQNRTVFLRGSGLSEKILAYIVPNQQLRLPTVQSLKQNFIVSELPLYELSEYAGIRVHGIVGYDFFSRFVVEINYDKKIMKLFEPSYYEKYSKKRSKKYSQKYIQKNQKQKNTKQQEIIPLILQERKPYFDTQIVNSDCTKTTLRLLLDTGATHSLSLDVTDTTKIQPPKTIIKSVLGNTLSGNILGKIGRLEKFTLGNFEWQDMIANFPDTSFVVKQNQVKSQGSIGVGILKRFTVTIDYPHQKLILLPNRHLNEPFHYTFTGIDITAKYPDYKTYIISNVIAQSPADEAGLKIGDELIVINEQVVKHRTLSELYSILDKRPNMILEMLIKRNNLILLIYMKTRKML